MRAAARRLLIVCTLATVTLAPAQNQGPAAPKPELAQVEKTLQSLNELKAKVAAISTELDQLIAEMSELKGSLATTKGPPAFGGMDGGGSVLVAADGKPKMARCAAITAKGERCTRPAVPGSRYCKQHQVAHQ